MISRLFHAVVIVGASLGDAGCSGADPASSQGDLTSDGQSGDDTQVTAEEVSGDARVNDDTGKAGPDGAVVDSEKPAKDSGLGSDTGTPAVDTGIPPFDTGTSTGDTGIDTGLTAFDAGSDVKKTDAFGETEDAWFPTK